MSLFPALQASNFLSKIEFRLEPGKRGERQTTIMAVQEITRYLSFFPRNFHRPRGRCQFPRRRVAEYTQYRRAAFLPLQSDPPEPLENSHRCPAESRSMYTDKETSPRSELAITPKATHKESIRQTGNQIFKRFSIHYNGDFFNFVVRFDGVPQ